MYVFSFIENIWTSKSSFQILFVLMFNLDDIENRIILWKIFYRKKFYGENDICIIMFNHSWNFIRRKNKSEFIKKKVILTEK